MSGVTKTVIVLVAVMALLVGGAVNRILSPTIMTPEQLRENGLFVYDFARRFPDFELVDHAGKAFTKDDLRGQWTLIFFGFTHCPDICPTTMATLSRFSEDLEAAGYADNTQVLMVSVDPLRDTPDKLSEYVGFFNPEFKGVTGEFNDIFNFAQHLNIAFHYVPGPQEGVYDVSHSGEIVLLNPRGHFHGFFKVPHEVPRMLENFISVKSSYQG